MPCVGTMDVWHSVFADLEDDLTVGTVVKTVVVVVSRAGQAKRVPGRPKLLCRFTDFWLQNEARAWSWVPAAVRCASGQGLGSRFICVLCGQGAAARTHSVPPWHARQTVLGRQNGL